MIEAHRAPAVPGAKGEKPEPKPVPIKTGKKGGLFISYNRVYKNNKTFPLLKKGKVYIFFRNKFPN